MSLLAGKDLRDVCTDHVLAEAERWCAPLMRELWGPDWRTLVNRVA